MRIYAYAICWNEEIMLPYYLHHYEKFVEKIIIYDNNSKSKLINLINLYKDNHNYLIPKSEI